MKSISIEIGMSLINSFFSNSRDMLILINKNPDINLTRIELWRVRAFHKWFSENFVSALGAYGAQPVFRKMITLQFEV